jgi:hypothetical protein
MSNDFDDLAKHGLAEIIAKSENELAWWMRMARAVLKHHEHQLVDAERGFISTLANRKSKPSMVELKRLKITAGRFGIEA